MLVQHLTKSDLQPKVTSSRVLDARSDWRGMHRTPWHPLLHHTSTLHFLLQCLARTGIPCYTEESNSLCLL